MISQHPHLLVFCDSNLENKSFPSLCDGVGSIILQGEEPNVMAPN